MARQKEFESPTFRLGVDPIRHREVTSNAYYAAAKEATESAFGKLGLKLANSGYKSTQRSVSNEG